jgi:hypothetical protein
MEEMFWLEGKIEEVEGMIRQRLQLAGTMQEQEDVLFLVQEWLQQEVLLVSCWRRGWKRCCRWRWARWCSKSWCSAWKHHQIEREEARACCEEELHELRRREIRQEEQRNMMFQLAMTGIMAYFGVKTKENDDDNKPPCKRLVNLIKLSNYLLFVSLRAPNNNTNNNEARV